MQVTKYTRSPTGAILAASSGRRAWRLSPTCPQFLLLARLLASNAQKLGWQEEAYTVQGGSIDAAKRQYGMNSNTVRKFEKQLQQAVEHVNKRYKKEAEKGRDTATTQTGLLTAQFVNDYHDFSDFLKQNHNKPSLRDVYKQVVGRDAPNCSKLVLAWHVAPRLICEHGQFAFRQPHAVGTTSKRKPEAAQETPASKRHRA